MAFRLRSRPRSPAEVAIGLGITAVVCAGMGVLFIVAPRAVANSEGRGGWIGFFGGFANSFPEHVREKVIRVIGVALVGLGAFGMNFAYGYYQRATDTGVRIVTGDELIQLIEEDFAGYREAIKTELRAANPAYEFADGPENFRVVEPATGVSFDVDAVAGYEEELEPGEVARRAHEQLATLAGAAAALVAGGPGAASVPPAAPFAPAPSIAPIAPAAAAAMPASDPFGAATAAPATGGPAGDPFAASASTSAPAAPASAPVAGSPIAPPAAAGAGDGGSTSDSPLRPAEILIEKAKKNWDEGNFEVSILLAERALAIYTEHLPAGDPKIAAVEAMIDAAHEKAK